MSDTDLPAALGRRLFKEAADHAFHAITVTRAPSEDRPGEIVYVNDAFTDMTGYEAEDVVGHTPGLLQGPKTEQDVLDRLRRRMESGEVFHGRTINYRKDGSEFMIEWKVIPIAQVSAVGEGNDEAVYHVAVQREVPAEEG